MNCCSVYFTLSWQGAGTGLWRIQRPETGDSVTSIRYGSVASAAGLVLMADSSPAGAAPRRRRPRRDQPRHRNKGPAGAISDSVASQDEHHQPAHLGGSHLRAAFGLFGFGGEGQAAIADVGKPSIRKG
jgi:hypothetical protein